MKGLVEEPGTRVITFFHVIAYLASLYNGLSFSANGNRQKWEISRAVFWKTR